MEEQAITRLMELDAKAEEISAGREKQLAELERRYKEEEQKMVADLSCRIEDESKEVAQKILQEAQQEVEKLNKRTAKALDDMEQKFRKVHQSLTLEILKRIFDIKRENHG